MAMTAAAAALVPLLAAAAAASAAPASRPATTAPAASVVAECPREGDSTEVRQDEAGRRTLVVIRSRRGIGKAVLRRRDEGEAWPRPLMLRLHLRGLESIAVQCGTVRRTGAAGRAGDDEAGAPSLVVRAFDASGKAVEGLPPVTPDGGYFEVEVPPAVLDAGGDVEVAWIDFYRG